MSSEPPALPRALDDDDDDVAWALQTAAVQWERGGVADAVVWLKRAAEAAAEAGEFGRSADIQRRANEIERWLTRKPSFPQYDDGDDGVDELLATDAPDIEAGVMAEPTQSLVDALEAEAQDYREETTAPVHDLGDLQDVEDIEAVDLDEFEAERELDGYAPLEEITHARSEIKNMPELPHAPARARPPSKARRESARPAPQSQRGAESSRQPAKSKRASEAPRSSQRKPGKVPPPVAPPKVPPPPVAPGKVPPPPVPRPPLPLPVPKSNKPPPPVDLPEPRGPFPSEPPTQPSSERPPPPDMPAPRPPAESMPEVAPHDIELPTLEPPPRPSDEPPRRPSIAARFAEHEPPVSVAAPAELDAAVAALHETPPPPPALDPELLAACRGLEDLPPETQAELAAKARIDVLAPDQEIGGFGLALVTKGNVVVMPTIAEGACGYAARGEPVFSRGTLSEGVPLRVVALQDGAEVASWRPDDFEHVLETCPWVADELRAVADRFQALAGAAMGPLGERLDDHMRQMLTDRCELLVLQDGDQLIEEGKPPNGLYIVGGGHLDLVKGGNVERELVPGDLPFASSVLTHEPATATVRAGAGGALVLHADRMSAHELIVSVPPLLELLSMV